MVVARPDISICYGFQGSVARGFQNGREGVMNLSGVIRWTSDEILPKGKHSLLYSLQWRLPG